MRKSSEKGKDNHSINDLEEVVVMKEKELSLGEEILYQLNEYFTEDEISSIDGNEKFVDRDSSLEIDIFDNIGNITTSNAHNGRIISDINYNPDIKYLVTNSVTDKSIIGWKIDDDKILQNRYFKYTDSDFLADLDKKKRFSAHLDDVYKNKYVILRNHYNCYCRVLDLTKGRYLKFPTNMRHKYVKGFFVDNKSKELMMVKEYGSHNSYKGTDQVRFYKFKIDDETDQLIYETTYYLYGDEYPSINCKSEELLIANPNTLITNWDKKKLKYKHDYDILYRYGEALVYNNNKSMVAIVYNSIKKIITFSLENNRMYSSLDYKRDKTVKKLLFINTEDKSEEYLLVVMYCNSKKNLEYRLIDPYNLGNSMDITDYFNENVLLVSDEDAGVTIGPVVADNKIIVISNVNDVVTLGGGDSCSSGFSATTTTTNGSSSINFNSASIIDTITNTVSVNHIYIKEVIDKDKLDMSNLVLQSKKAAYLDKKITSLGNVIHNYDPPERIVTLQQEGSSLSSVKWVVEYDENFNNIIVSVQVFVNKHGEECWRTIDTYDLEAQERFLYCELVKAHLLLVSNSCVYVFEILIHDDQNYVRVDEIGYESKIRMMYYREITYKNRKIKLRTRYRYDTIEEKVVNIYGIFDEINKTYVSNKKIPRQPLREALRNLLSEFYSFEKYGRKVLKEALDRDNSLIVEEIFNSYLYWFKKDSNSNISILGGIISELPRMEKHDHRLLSRFFAQTSMLLLMSNPITSNYDTLYTAYTRELFIYQKGSFWRFYYHFIRRVEELIKGKKSARKISNVIKQPAVHLIIPYPGFMSYPTNYSFFDELMYRPATNVFIELEHEEIYKHSTYKTILDFKWNTFGFNYYMGIWIIYTIFLLIFAIATTTERQQFSEHHRDVLLINCIVFGTAHFLVEARQFTWNPKRYILDFWNCFDLGAYLLPVITSSYWLIHEPPPIWLISASNLLMDLKFMLFLRGIKYFGSYFAIILGVAKKVFSFLLILFLIIISFSHALYILLRPNVPYHLEHPDFNDDPNNPWNLVRRYITINTANDTYDDRTIFSDIPDGDTNMFTYFPSSLLAMYSFLTGDNSAVAAWSIQNDPYLAILVVIFSFIVVVYLMNLFIGLLSNAIEENNTEEAFLAEKAKIIKEIELFCLFPNQRRWRNWFPEILHYPVSIDDVRKGIKEVDESKRKDSNSIPFISDELRNLVGMPEPPKKETSILTVVDNRLEENEKKLMRQMQILLDEIKILKNNDDDQFS